jgi:hypothetical protein
MLGAGQGMHRQAPAPGLRGIHHVVVDQREAMQQFQRGTQLDQVAVAAAVVGPAGRHPTPMRHPGPKQLAGCRGEVAHQGQDRVGVQHARPRRDSLRQHPPLIVEFAEGLLDQVEHGIDGGGVARGAPGLVERGRPVRCGRVGAVISPGLDRCQRLLPSGLTSAEQRACTMPKP